MTAPVVIALDAMGGDRAPQIVVRGAELARERFPQVEFLMFGDEAKIAPLLDKYDKLAAVTTLRHSEGVILNEDKPSTALRSGRDSSMRHAIDAVSAGEASAVISAGNTGALMAFSRGSEVGVLSIVSAASTWSPAVPIIGGIFVFNERLTSSQSAGLAVAISGLLILALSG